MSCAFSDHDNHGIGQKNPLDEKGISEEHNNKRNSQQRLPASFLQWFEELLMGRTSSNNDDYDENTDNSALIKARRRRRLVILSVLSLLVAAYIRRSSRRRRQQSIASDSTKGLVKTSSALWPVSLLVAWWKGAEYKQNPQQSTMNLLYSAAQDGLIHKALVGSNAIYYQTGKKQSQEKRWNRTALPSNNDSIKSSLLEVLANHHIHVEALPESIGSQLSTPVLTAIPFIYLALVYKILKSQFGGEDISSKLTDGTRKIWGAEESDRTTFADVAGIKSAVEDMSEVVSYLSDPSLYTTMGARPPKGVLLHGPPGSGSK